MRVVVASLNCIFAVPRGKGVEDFFRAKWIGGLYISSVSYCRL